jgi:hypothetical protein
MASESIAITIVGSSVNLETNYVNKNWCSGDLAINFTLFEFGNVLWCVCVEDSDDTCMARKKEREREQISLPQDFASFHFHDFLDALLPPISLVQIGSRHLL